MSAGLSQAGVLIAIYERPKDAEGAADFLQLLQIGCLLDPEPQLGKPGAVGLWVAASDADLAQRRIWMTGLVGREALKLAKSKQPPRVSRPPSRVAVGILIGVLALFLAVAIVTEIVR